MGSGIFFSFCARYAETEKDPRPPITMDSLRELYQDVILDHHRKPRNRREMPEASAKASGYNPLCGDRVAVYVKVAGDVLEDVSFVGSGCAISQASASMMTD